MLSLKDTKLGRRLNFEQVRRNEMWDRVLVSLIAVFLKKEERFAVLALLMDMHSVSKGGTMNTLEEIETVKVASGSSYLLNDLTATFSNPFIRYYFNDSLSSS